MNISPIISIDQQAITHNLSILKQNARGCPIIAVIKTHGYGHQYQYVTEAMLGSVDYFAVANLEEAIILREYTTMPIIILGGIYTEEQIDLCIKDQFSLVVHHPLQLQTLLGSKRSGLLCWIKCDIGMHRLGFSLNDSCEQLMNIINKLQGKHCVEGILTHYSCADLPNTYEHKKQKKIVEKLRNTIPPNIKFSASNSAAILSGIARAEYARPGLALFGVSPFEGTIGRDFGLIPTMDLKSSIISINFISAGTPVGYGCSFISKKNMKIGVVSMGYGWGYPYSASPGTPILVNNKRVPLIGRVSMNMLMVDLSTLKDVKIGDEATLWGKELPIEVIAKHANTLPHVLLTNVSITRLLK